MRRELQRLTRQLTALYVFLLIGWTASPAAAAESAPWPQFLGPHRNGISSETGLLDRFPEDGLKEMWRVAGSVGVSGLAIADGRLITVVQRSGKQFVVAHNARTGKPIWQTAIAPAYKNQMADGPRGTPAIAGDQVFAFSGEGVLAALNASDGTPVWSHNVVKELRGRVADYGMAGSPLVAGDVVIVTAGAPRASVVAYDRKTGELAWQAGNDPAGYSSPALLDGAGQPQLVAYTGNSLLGINPQSGAVLWRYPYVTNFECNIATPLSIKGRVFLSSGENHGSVLLNVKRAGDRFATEEVWSSQGPRSVLRNEWQTSILLGDYLYGWDNVGGAGPITHLTCIKAATGERVWQERRFGKGNMIAAEGKLLMTTFAGEFVLARATPDSYEELGRAKVLESTRQAPALANGLLYLRDNNDILCLDVRKH